jgi:multiple sugar transport system substrate-binding protein
MKAYTEKIIEDFEKEYGVEVDFQYVSDTDAPQKYASAIEGNNPPDLAEFGTPGLVKYAAVDQLTDLESLFNELSGMHGGHFDIAQQAVSYNGVIYGIPVGFQAQLSFWRKDVLEDNGFDVPSSWAELYDVATVVNDPGNNFFGIGQPLSNCNDTRQWFRGILWGHGGSVVAEDGETITLNSPATIAAIEWVKKGYDEGLYPDGALGWDGGGNNAAYLSRRALYVENAMSVYTAMVADDQELLDDTHIGGALAGPERRASFGGVFSYAIFKDAKNPDLAKEFIRYFYDYDRYSKFIQAAGGYYTPTYESFTELKMFDNPYLQPLMSQVEYSHATGFPGDPSPAAQEVFDRHILIDMLQHVLVDGWDTQRAIEDAAKRVEDIYARYR